MPDVRYELCPRCSQFVRTYHPVMRHALLFEQHMASLGLRACSGSYQEVRQPLPPAEPKDADDWQRRLIGAGR